MERRTLILSGAAIFLAGCSGTWQVDYDEGVAPSVSKSWDVQRVVVSIPDRLTVSTANTYAPNADIVWHGEPVGTSTRREQVRQILSEGVERGAAGLNGSRPVGLSAQLEHFHAVTPAAVARAPGAVHNIAFRIQAFDLRSGEPITEPQRIQADLEAFVGAAAITAAIDGQTQRVRIVDHLARVTAGWLGTGADQRRTFQSVGR